GEATPVGPRRKREAEQPADVGKAIVPVTGRGVSHGRSGKRRQRISGGARAGRRAD
nr:hypothetical protein [Tanacetum cinerariifolium]